MDGVEAVEEEHHMVEFQSANYHTITPYLSVEDAPALIDFLTSVLDGKEVLRMEGPDGTIAHAEVRIGDSTVMLTHASEVLPAYATALYVYVPDVDATYRRGLDGGATSSEEPSDKFYGDRTAGFVDPWGNRWMVATQVEDVSEEEMGRRIDEQTGSA